MQLVTQILVVKFKFMSNKLVNFYINRYNHDTKKGVSYMDLLDQKIASVKSRLKEEFLADTRPWVVTFSGGKDSTTVLHLVVEMLLEMRDSGEKQSKQVYIVSSDTGVEMPLIEDYVGDKLKEIENFSKEDLYYVFEYIYPHLNFQRHT